MSAMLPYARRETCIYGFPKAAVCTCTEPELLSILFSISSLADPDFENDVRVAGLFLTLWTSPL